MKAAEDCVTIFESGGVHSFFDDGGGETWHIEWKIRHVDEDDIPEEERGGIIEGKFIETIQEAPVNGKYFRSPFGLSGVFAARFIGTYKKLIKTRNERSMRLLPPCFGNCPNKLKAADILPGARSWIDAFPVIC